MTKFIDWEKIEVRGSRSGVKKTTCPNCSHERKKKKDPCLYVNFDSGVAKCFNCEALGFKESKEYEPTTYNLPPQEWLNFTNLSDELVKWVKTERKISQQTLIHFGITEEKHYQPAKRKEMNNIVFNSFEGEKLVNKKYRSGTKDFTQVKGGKPIFYNINSAIGQDEVYIVEGEFDVLALYEVGVKNVISLPNGANDNDEFWKNSEKYLKDVKKFIIGTDNDEKGIIVRDKISHRLGKYRCEYLEWQNKDANGDLVHNVIRDSLSARKRFPVNGVFSALDLKGGILDLHRNGLPKTIYPKDDCFGKLKDSFSVMRGQVTTITGIPSHGKSNFSEWYILNLVNDYDLKASFFSPEHSPMELHKTNFIQKAVGKPFWGKGRVSEQDIERYVEWANEKIYLTGIDNGEGATWDWLLNKFKEQIYGYGVDMFVVDAFNKVALPNGSQREEINKVLTKLTSFAQANDVLIFLVAHPTKMRKDDKTGLYEVPTLYDVSGSADFRNQTHNGFGIYRYFANSEHNGYTMFTNLKTKFSFQGDIGVNVEFDYDIPTGRYYQRGTHVPMFDMTVKEYVQEEIKIAPNDEFDDESSSFWDNTEQEEAPF